jgi:polar amino acid transport system substrate-binding protein
MKKNLYIILLVAIAAFLTFYSFKKEVSSEKQIVFGTEALYPPFEFSQKGRLVGFDIDLAYLIARELGRKVVFFDMQFSSILPAVNSGKIDIALASITITEERKQNFDFSVPYYIDGLSVIYNSDSANSINNFKYIRTLEDKKIACQLGSIMEMWVKNNVPTAKLILVDNNNQAIEMLKSGQVDAVIINDSQASVYVKENVGLSAQHLEKTDDGKVAAVLKKNSPLTEQVNRAINSLKASGKIAELEKKWISIRK